MDRHGPQDRHGQELDNRFAGPSKGAVVFPSLFDLRALAEGFVFDLQLVAAPVRLG
jgi:hypothetical protein